MTDEDKLSWRLSEGPPVGPSYDGKDNQRPKIETRSRGGSYTEDPHPPGERLSEQVEPEPSDTPEEPTRPSADAGDADEILDGLVSRACSRGGYVRRTP